jgi:RNA polymerase sigma-70 factor (ECF subfamily)
MGGREEAPATEKALLRAVQAGNPGALEQLVATHKQPLFVLCFGILGHTDDAEDAVQEVFLRALAGLPRFRGDASFRTWLFRIALNLCLNWKRDQRPTETWDEACPPAARAVSSPEQMAIEQLRLTEALGQLPTEQRAIFLLKVVEGWSLAEIALAVGWNRIRVKNELAKARRTLAEWQLRDEEEGAER